MIVCNTNVYLTVFIEHLTRFHSKIVLISKLLALILRYGFEQLLALRVPLALVGTQENTFILD